MSPRSSLHGARRITVRATLVVCALATLGGCGAKHPSAPGAGGGSGTRAYRMGFSSLPPVFTLPSTVQNLETWTTRADGALEHIDVPWDSLIAGVTPEALLNRDHVPLVAYYRGKGLAVTYEVDLTNGLDRASDAPALRARGASLANPAMQALAVRWIAALDSLLAPDDLGIGSETNLVRLAAPDSLYRALVRTSHAADSAIVAFHSRHGTTPPRRYTSVQVETAWGRLGGTSPYRGIAQDLIDFPFGARLGLSCYPYLGGFTSPEQIPDDYLSRLANESGRPVMIVEGGWSSLSVAGSSGSPALQARYVRRMRALLDAANAAGWYQLEFADLALSTWPPQPPGSILPWFATLGLTDSAFTAKPALGAWDSTFARTRTR